MKIHIHIPTCMQFALDVACDDVARHGIAGLPRQIPVPLYYRCVVAFAQKYGKDLSVKRLYDMIRRGEVDITGFTVLYPVAIMLLDHVALDSLNIADIPSVIEGLMLHSHSDIDAVVQCIHRFAMRCLKHNLSVYLSNMASAMLKRCPCKAIRQVLIQYGAKLDPSDVASSVACGMNTDVLRALHNGYEVKRADIVRAVISGDEETIMVVANTLGERRKLSAADCVIGYDLNVPMYERLLELGVMERGVRYQIAYVNNTATMKWLIANKMIDTGYAVIHAAEMSSLSCSAHVDMLHYLVEQAHVSVPNGAFESVSPYTDDLGVFDYLLDHGADPASKDKYLAVLFFRYWLDKSNVTPRLTNDRAISLLKWCIDSAIPSTAIDIFFEAIHMSLNTLNASDYSILKLAVEHTRLDIAELLLKHGADPNTCMYDVVTGPDTDVKIVELLLIYGGNPNASVGSSDILWHAMCWERVDTMKALLEHGADAKGTERFAQTSPLEKAVDLSRLDMVEMLLQHGADPNVNTTNHMPLLIDLCHMPYHIEPTKIEPIVKILLEHGANVNCQSDNGDTPLHEACEYAPYKIALLLLKHGADVNMTNNNGKTPYDLVDVDELQVRQVLVDYGYVPQYRFKE